MNTIQFIPFEKYPQDFFSPKTLVLCDFVCEQNGFVFSFTMPNEDGHGWYTEMRMHGFVTSIEKFLKNN